MNVNPRIVRELYGNLPEDFEKVLADKIFYREYSTEFGTAVWIPKSSIMDCTDLDVLTTLLYSELKAAFENHPDFDSITLSNT
jgi:hypothetical protein